jgi:hypothetical protein
MGYDILLVRREVKQKVISDNFIFGEILETNDSEVILNFTENQLAKLQRRLKSYNFINDGAETLPISYKFKEEKHGISATLYANQLAFSSGFSQDAVFEILQTASEFCDDDNFAFYNFQDGSWTDIETY